MGKSVLCCKRCGNYFYSEESDEKCGYCGGNTEMLFTEEETQGLDKFEVNKMIEACREKYRDTKEYHEDLWRNREYREKIENEQRAEIKKMEQDFSLKLQHHLQIF